MLKKKMDKMDKIVDVTQVFLLRGIDPVEIEKNYLTGEYRTKDFPTEKIEIAKGIIHTDHQPGKDNQDEFYQYHDRMGELRTVVTTNHGYFLEESKGNYICLWCRDELGLESVGMPIEMKYEGDKIVFTIDQHFCCLECVYAFAKHLNSWNNIYRDPVYLNSEQLIVCMYHAMYPNSNQQLLPRSDWWLYERNGGPLNKSEYHSNSHVYQKTTNIIFKQIKREYIKIVRTHF